MGFDHLSLIVGLRGIVWEDRRAEIGAVDRVMYGDGEFEASLVSKERASDASPHRLRDIRLREREKTNEWGGQTLRLLNPEMFGFAELETLESLRLTALEDLDANSWGWGGGIILRDWSGVSKHSRHCLLYRARGSPDRHRT